MTSCRRRSAGLLSLVLALPLHATDKAEKTVKEPLSVQESKRRDAVEHFLRARLYIQDSEFEEAGREFRRAVELDPQDGNLRREYAEFLRDLSVLPDALREARKAVELAPASPGARRVYGQVLLALAKDKPAVENAASELKKANDAQPMDPQSAVPYAQALLKLERAKEATSVLEKVVERARGSAIPLLYGDALERSGQLQQAEEVYGSVVRQEPENRDATLRLLRVFERTRQFEKAVPLVEGFVRLQPTNLGLKTEFAGLLLRARRFSEAAKVLSDVLKSDPGNREALRHQATLLSETRETDRADEVLRRLAKLDPDDLEVPFRRALNFLDARRVEEAEKILLELRDTLVAKKKSPAEMSQIDGQLGYCAYLRKDYVAARNRLTPHLLDEEGGVNGQAFNLLSQIARDKEEWAEGLKVARQVTEKSERARKSPAVRAVLAEFQIRAGETAQGERTLDDIAREDRAGALVAADAWQRLDRYGRAADTAKAALETQKDDPDLLFRYAASLEREKKIAESVAAFEKLIAVRPDHAAALNYLGYLWADRGENLQRALELIQKAVDLDPSNGAYLDSLGWAYFRLNDLERAESNLKAASTLNPDDATIEEHLGDLYERRGELDRARAAWKRALTLKPDDGGKKLQQKLSRTEGRVVDSRR